MKTCTSMERHFRIMLALMLFFFSVDIAADTLLALRVATVKIGGSLAHDGYLTLAGIAFGMFRGMSPADGGAKGGDKTEG